MRLGRNLGVLAWTAVLLALLLPAIAGAAVVPMNVEELARSADAIVTAKLLDSGSRKGVSARGGIEGFPVVTDTRFQVAKVIKGSRPDQVLLTQPGGVLGDRELVVTDLPEFAAAGERYILFLNSEGGIVGGYQGRLQIVGGQVPALGVKLADAEKLLSVLGDESTASGWSQARRIDPTYPADYQASITAAQLTYSETAAPESTDSASAPIISVVSPLGTPANVPGEVVEISGTGFGSARGTGKIEFRDGRSRAGVPIAASVIKYWSDTRIVCEVPRYAQSGAVVVTTGSGGVSAGLNYTVGFSRSGLQANGTTFKYRINENSPDLSAEGAAIQSAFATWNGAGSNLKFAYGGACSSTRNRPLGDDHSDIYFASSGFSDPGMLGWNVYWKKVGSSTIIESDIVLNDTYSWSNAPGKGQHDVESVVLHELGHTVGLDDQYAELERVMGASMSGSTRRALSWAEVDGHRYIYGSAGQLPVTKLAAAVSLSAPSVSAYRSARLAGRVTDSAGKALHGKPVRLEYSYDKQTWRILELVYTTKKDSSGRYYYEYTAKPEKKTYYRAVFAGDSVYAANKSSIRGVLPKVYLTRPSFGRITLAYGTTYSARGYLKPRHTAGTYPVRIYAYRYVDGKYRYVRSYRAKAYNYSSYTKYRASIKLPAKGKWRLRTVHEADSKNTKTYSSYRYVTVK